MKPKIIVIGGEEFEVPDGTTREQFSGYLAKEGITASPAELAAAFPTPGAPPAAASAPEGSGFFGAGGPGDVATRFAKGAGSEVDPRGIVDLARAFDAEQRQTPGMPYEGALVRTLGRGLVEPLKGLPDAARRVMAGDVAGGLDAGARSLPFVGPTYGNVSDRLGRGDVAGAIGAGTMGALTTLLPAAKAASPALAAKIPSATGMLARGAVALPRAGAVRMAEGILDTDKAAARAVLAEGGMRTTIPAGIRKLGRRAHEATETAATSAPAGQRMGPPTRVGFGPNVTEAYRANRSQTGAATQAIANEVREAIDSPTMHSPTISDAIRQAEYDRTRVASPGVSGVLGQSGPAADAVRAISADQRLRARPSLPGYGQRALDTVDRVAGPQQTLAAARNKFSPSQGTGALAGAGGGTRGMIAHGLAMGGAPISQLLYGGLTEQAIQKMLQAAVLARLTGGDDDEQPEP